MTGTEAEDIGADDSVAGGGGADGGGAPAAVLTNAR